MHKIKLKNQRYFNIDSGHVTSVVFLDLAKALLDLAKAFDAIDQNILLEELSLLAVGNDSIPWLNHINSRGAKGKPVSYGVPQGICYFLFI